MVVGTVELMPKTLSFLQDNAMTELQVTARLTIHAGKLDVFNAVAAKCIESVRTKDTGTLQYDWFMNADNTVCVVTERYKDSQAVFEHIGNLGETMGELLSVSTMDLEVYGVPSQELIDATAEMGAKVYSPLTA